MGLDWVPMNKAKDGFEAEFQENFNEFFHPKPGGFFDVFSRKKSKKELARRFQEISVSAYETLNAPRVGVDSRADEWARKLYESGKRAKTFEEFMAEMKGYYVLALVPECDGIPVYVSNTIDRYAFRGQFLEFCAEILGKETLGEAWNPKLPADSLAYGKKLMALADEYAAANNCGFLKDQRACPETEEGTPQFKAHILFSAAKWLIFWAEKGHGMEADF